MFPSRDQAATNSITGENRFKHETDQFEFDTARNFASEGTRPRKKYQKIDIDAGVLKTFKTIPGFRHCWLGGRIELLRYVGAVFLVAFLSFYI